MSHVLAFWRAVHDGERVEMTRTADGLYFEVGSDQNVSKRDYEGHGGTLTLEQFRTHPEYFAEYPGFYERVLADLDATEGGAESLSRARRGAALR